MLHMRCHAGIILLHMRCYKLHMKDAILLLYEKRQIYSGASTILSPLVQPVCRVVALLAEPKTPLESSVFI